MSTFSSNVTQKIIGQVDVTVSIPDSTSSIDVLSAAANQRFKVHQIFFHGAMPSQSFLRMKTTSNRLVQIVQLQADSDNTFVNVSTTVVDDVGGVVGVLVTFKQPFVVSPGQKLNVRKTTGGTLSRIISFYGEFSENTP